MRLRYCACLIFAALICPGVRAERSVIPQWIWFPEGDPRQSAPAAERFFRKAIDLADDPSAAKIDITADDHFTLFINGKEICRDDNTGGSWQRLSGFDVPKIRTRGED